MCSTHKYGVRGWKLNNVCVKSDAQAILRKFGGMGSINDLYICSANGHSIKVEDEAAANQELQSLLECIYAGCKSKAE
jgi:hypothetical protein